MIRNAEVKDFESICALNFAEVQHTSPMDAALLEKLHRSSCYHKVACMNGKVAAFLLALGSGASYENDNFEWFSRKFTRFVYVDRIVVSADFRGLRLASLLYEDLFCYARKNEYPRVTCEYNILPLNEPSRLFHDKLGFKEYGTQWVADATKRVSLQAVEIV